MKGVMSFLSGAIMGGLVGATLALLFAPASGEQLRLQMQERADRIQQEVKQAAESRRIELEQQLAELRAPRESAGP
ncbi:MAG: YtxH domain-containing protein [Anaerolineales bacterium]|jgi:gas vesicle protein